MYIKNYTPKADRRASMLKHHAMSLTAGPNLNI